MTELATALLQVYKHEGAQEYANKFYIIFFRTNLYLPVIFRDDPDEPFSPHAVISDDKRFIPVFSTVEALTEWAELPLDKIDHVNLIGQDLMKAVGHENVYLSLDPGTEHYKEFAPEEIVRLKVMVAKLDKLKASCK